jgi:hypothetical protein
MASINFDDTNSIAPPAGVTNTVTSVTPWNGSILTLASTTDPFTLDTAMGSIDASFIFASNTYALNLSNVTLTQVSTNTGWADLIFTFNVEYQLDAAGLPLQPTLYPNFVVNGTVQPAAGSFALVSGFIDYSGVTTAGTIGVVETVNYNSLWTTPGPFTAIAAGTPVFGTTPLLIGNTTLTLNGVIHFRVDPAHIDVFSVMVPEPATWTLATLGMAGFGLVALRRRRV